MGYPLVNQHSYGKSPSLPCKSIINRPFSMAMLNCQRVHFCYWARTSMTFMAQLVTQLRDETVPIGMNKVRVHKNNVGEIEVTVT